MATLIRLAKSPGASVSRKELLEDVWEKRAVVPQVVAKAIHQLRSVLEDDPKKPSFILTLPKLGYCLNHPLIPVSPEEASRGKKWPVKWLAYGFAASMVFAGAVLSLGYKKHQEGPLIHFQSTRYLVEKGTHIQTEAFREQLKGELIQNTCIGVTQKLATEASKSKQVNILLETAILEGEGGLYLQAQLIHEDSGRYFWTDQFPIQDGQGSQFVAASIVKGIKEQFEVPGCETSTIPRTAEKACLTP